MNQEYQLQKLRTILLDEELPNAERVAAQKQIMKILDLKERKYAFDNNDYLVEIDDITKRRL